jgi:hypothetical protein
MLILRFGQRFMEKKALIWWWSCRIRNLEMLFRLLLVIAALFPRLVIVSVDER